MMVQRYEFYRDVNILIRLGKNVVQRARFFM